MGRSLIALLGMGNMGGILLKAMASLPSASPGGITVFDADSSRLKFGKFGKTKGLHSATSARKAVEGKTLVVLAVKPQNMKELLHDIQDALSPEALVVSVAAGIETTTIQSWLGRTQKVVRAMPNTPAQIKTGMTALCFSPEVGREERGTSRRLFNRIGQTVVVPEEQMDAVTALSGSGPAYLFLFADSLVEGGAKAGLPRETAYKMVTQTIFGAVKMLIKTGLSPNEQIKKVASPGGTTVAGLSALEKGKFRETIISCVEAAAGRARELGEITGQKASAADKLKGGGS